ncbi:MAG: ATP-dependent carboxylate-amine ligase [Alphaproteobacteria bacterium]
MQLARRRNASVGNSFLLTMLTDLAPEFDAEVYCEPEYGYVGYVEFPHGRRCFFRSTTFDINPQAASSIAKDKDYCAKLLKHMGYSVPEGVLLFSQAFRQKMRLRNEQVAERLGCAEAAIAFAEKWGFPLFLKPNEGSEGRGVIKVDSIEALFEALWGLFHEEDKVLLQAPVKGRDYRIVVLDGEVVSAYERVPFAITGDGQSSVAQLLDAGLARLRTEKRGSKISAKDPRIATELRSQNIAADFVPPDGQIIRLLPNANLSTGGTSIDVTGKISARFRDLAASIARDVGLTLAGIDIIADNICASKGDYCVLEVNSAPGLNNFAGSSKQAKTRTRDLYRKLLAYMARA